MNDTAKPADTPIADIEMNTELAIEELEKIVAPELTTTTTKPSSVTKKQDWMPDDRSSA